MKTFEQNMTGIPEGTQRGDSLLVPETASQVDEILETPTLQAKSRNLDYAEVQSTLVEQLREYAEKAKVESLVLGVSGGVDSGLVSTLCAETGLKVVCVELPIHQKSDEVNRAQNHIAWLKKTYPNVTSFSVDLTESFETLKKALPQIENEEVVRYMAYVNTRSRLRGVTLYALANEKNGIVVGTGNKVEDYGIGFFTKYGDGAVDVSPIGELLKSEVRALARHMGVNPEISEAIPTDGLHSTGATDEDQIGASYDELEWALQQVDEYKSSTASNFISWKDSVCLETFKKTFSGRQKKVMEIYLSRHLSNEHKMSMPSVFRILDPTKSASYYDVHQ